MQKSLNFEETVRHEIVRVIFTEKKLQSLGIVGSFEKLSDCLVCVVSDE